MQLKGYFIKDQHKNFILFLRFGAFNLLFTYLYPDLNYFSNFSALLNFDTTSFLTLAVPMFPGLPIEIASLKIYWAALEFYFILSMILIFVFPKARISYFNGFFSILLRQCSFHYMIGVDIATMYLVPFFFLFLIPPTREKTVKVAPVIITAVASCYLFSCLNKLNPVYLHRFPFKDDLLRSIWKHHVDHPVFVYFASSTGVVLQALGSLIQFQKLRKIGLVALLLFHFLVSVNIIYSVSLAFFGYSLLLLFVLDKDMTRYAKVLFVLRSSFWLSECIAMFIKISPATQDLISILISFLGFLLGLFCLTYLNKESHFKFSKLGFFIPLSLFTASFAFQLPEPFGYSQYSFRSYHLRFLGIPLEDANKAEEMFSTPGRWSVWVRKLDTENLFIAKFTYSPQADKFLNFYCSKVPEGHYKDVTTPEKIPGRGRVGLGIPYLARAEWKVCKKIKGPQ